MSTSLFATLLSRLYRDQPPSAADDDGPRLAPAPSANGDNGEARPDRPLSSNGDNGRGADGRFVKGNAGGPGNPFDRHTATLRRALAAVVSEEDVQTLVRILP